MMTENPEFTFPTCTPEEAGIPSFAILEFLKRLEKEKLELHGLKIYRNGFVLSEGYFQPFTPDKAHRLFSAAKAVIAVGILKLIQDGFIGLEQNLAEFFPEYRTKQIEKITLYHLLTMTAGHKDDSFYEYLSDPSKDLTDLFFKYPFVDEPGTKFFYDNGIPHVLMLIIERISGKNLMDFLNERIFKPLGIKDVYCGKTISGIYDPATIRMTLDSLLRIAVMLLNKGTFSGTRLLDEQLVLHSVSRHFPTVPPFGSRDINTCHGQGYCFQMWKNKNGGFRIDGGRGQICMVIPEENLILATNARIMSFDFMLDIFSKTVIPYLSSRPLAQNSADYNSLKSRLETLSLFPGSLLTSNKDFSGDYILEKKIQGMSTLKITTANDSIDVTVNRKILHAGVDGRWIENNYNFDRLFKLSPAEIISDAEKKIYVSGGWTLDDELMLHIRFEDSMDCTVLKINFSDYGIKMTLSNNADKNTIILKGKKAER